MNIIQKDKTYDKVNSDVRRSIDMSIKRLESRLSNYIDQDINAGKIFNDDILIHNVINKKFYVYKSKVNQMQIRILYTVDEDNNLVILSHWYKNRTNNDYIKYFKELTSIIKA